MEEHVHNGSNAPEEPSSPSWRDDSSVAHSEAPSTSSSSISPHYDDKRDVIAQIECLSDKATKRIAQTIWGATAVGLALLITGLILVTTKPESYWFETSSIFIINTVFASLQILALSIMSMYFVRRIVRASLTGKRWSRRRLRGVQLSAAELTLQLINSILFLIPNADAIVHDCKWFSSLIVWTSFGRWTIWNSFFLVFLIQAANMMPLPQQYSTYKKNMEESKMTSTSGGDRWRWWFSLPGAGRRFLSPLALAKAHSSSDVEPTIYMDAPLWVHWPKMIIWIFMEAFLIALSIDLDRHPAGLPVAPQSPTQQSSCKTLEYKHNFTTTSRVLANLVAATAILYLLVYALFIFYCFRIFYALPYNKFRMGNLILRLQVRQRGLTFAFFIANIIVYFYVKQSSLASIILAWYGLTPMQIVNTVIVIAQVYMGSPKKPEQTAILQVWLQEFAWTEADIPRKKYERISSLPGDSFEGFCMDCEPLFCFETAVKLMYWSFLAYDTGELPGSPFSPATALGLYNLDHFDVVWEKALNTKAVIGWTDDPSCATVVIAFRGTASASNLLADFQVWRSKHPPGIGTPWLGTAPLVHQGFLKTYTKNGFHDRLLSKVQHILNRCQESVDTAVAAAEEADVDKKKEKSSTQQQFKPPIVVRICGHSLGGALAVLCAYDIATRSPCAVYDMDISCYTFGAPRVGNHAWAREYNSKVSDTWQLINSDDVVTRAGKFFFLFKHVGHRVLLNRRGDLVVRPSFVEYAIRRSPGGSVKDHYLSSYERAVVAVLATQFGSKAFNVDAKEGARAVAHSAGAKKLLDRAGLSLEDVQRLEEGRAQLTRQPSGKPRGLKRAVTAVGKEEVEHDEKTRRLREEEQTGYWLKPQIRQWLDSFAGTCLGRHELEPIVAKEEGKPEISPPFTIPETRVITTSAPATALPGGEVTAAETVGGGGGAGEGEFSEAQMEARHQAASGLLQCREMCSKMRNSPQKSRRNNIFGSGRGEGSGSGSGSGGGARQS